MNKSAAHKILIVDDNPRVRYYLKLALEGEGYLTDEAEDRYSAIIMIEKNRPDLILLDIRLGDEALNGLDLFKSLRQREIQTPVIFMTATGRQYLRRAFALGADDYVAKRDDLLSMDDGLRLSPAELLREKSDVEELLSRTRALLRRGQGHMQEPTWREVGPGIRADFVNQVVEVYREGRWVDARLTPTELAVFRVLVERAGRPAGRHQIIEAVADGRASGNRPETLTVRALESHISRLRSKLDGAGRIRAVQGIGYRLDAASVT